MAAGLGGHSFTFPWTKMQQADRKQGSSISFSVQPASDSLSAAIPHRFHDLPKHCPEGRTRVVKHLSLGDEGGISHSNHN